MPRKRTMQQTATSKPVDCNILEESKTTKATALATLKTVIPQIFMDAQRPNEHLRSDAIRLRDIQIACCLNTPRMIGQPEDIDPEGEQQFIKEVFRNINKVLPIRKREPHADRIVRFIASFLHYNQERDVIANEKRIEFNRRKARMEAKREAKRQARLEANDGEGDDPMSEDEEQEEDDEEELEESIAPENEEEEEDDIESISSRFVEQLLRHLLRGFTAKKLYVRLRCCQMVALSINCMGEIDEDLYQDLKTSLFERIRDKEASVRIQAADALCRLQSADTDIDQEDGRTILQKLVWLLQYDPSAEVRRMILFNIDPTPETISFIVERARDLDTMNRRVVYLKPLSEIPDFRMLSQTERIQVLKWGLNDRNLLVKKSTIKMMSDSWMEHAKSNLIEFLERLEVTNPDNTEIAEVALDAFFEARSEIVKELSFDDEFWSNMSPEGALLVKVLIKFLQKDQTMEERLDTILPGVTYHTNNLKYYNDLYRSPAQEEVDEYEFIITQMLEIALCLDYGDEVGRRKMFELLRDIMRTCELNEEHLTRMVKVFRLISMDERDFTRSIIEIISDIQEQLNSPFDDFLDDAPVAKRSKREDDGGMTSMEDYERSLSSLNDNSLLEDGGSRLERDNSPDTVNTVIRLRCLAICKHMLELSQQSLAENSSLYGLLNDLIRPAVLGHDQMLKEDGVHCLGLICLLDKLLAQQNVQLFFTCLKGGNESILRKSVMIFFDLIMTFGEHAINEGLELVKEGNSRQKIADLESSVTEEDVEKDVENVENDKTREETEQIEQIEEEEEPTTLRSIFEFCIDNDSSEVQAITAVGLSKLFLAKRYSDEYVLQLMLIYYFFPSKQVNNKAQQCLTYFFPAYCYSAADHQKSLAQACIPVLEELCNMFNDMEPEETMVNPTQIAEMLADWTDPRKLAKLHMDDIRRDDHDVKSQVPGFLAIQTLQTIQTTATGLQRKTICHLLTRLYLDEQEESKLVEIVDLIHTIETDCPIKESHVRNAVKKLSTHLKKIIAEYQKERGADVLSETTPTHQQDNESVVESVATKDDVHMKNIEQEDDLLDQEIRMEETGLDDVDTEKKEEGESFDESEQEVIQEDSEQESESDAVSVNTKDDNYNDAQKKNEEVIVSRHRRPAKTRVVIQDEDSESDVSK